MNSMYLYEKATVCQLAKDSLFKKTPNKYHLTLLLKSYPDARLTTKIIQTKMEKYCVSKTLWPLVYGTLNITFLTRYKQDSIMQIDLEHSTN